MITNLYCFFINRSVNPEIFEKVSGVIDSITPIPSLNQLENLIVQNPDVARWAEEVAKNRAVVKLKNAEAIPDVTIGAGPRYFNATDSTAFVMSFSMPIPMSILPSSHRMPVVH